MSAPAFAWAFEMGVRLELTSAQLLLLAYMADQANCVGSFFTGQPRLVKYTRLSERTVRQLIPQLEALGLIRVTSTPGKPTQYHIVRQPIGAEPNTTPAATAAPASGAAPANRTWVTPAATAPLPRQPLPPHPGKIRPQPRQNLQPTPAATAPDPLRVPFKSTQERARGRAQGKEDFQDREAEESQQNTAPAPAVSATQGSDTFNSYLDAPDPAKAIPCEIEQEVVSADPLDLPVDPEYVRATVAALRHELRMRAYPPRAATMSREDQIAELLPKPHIRPAYLSDAVLRQLRAVRAGGVPV